VAGRYLYSVAGETPRRCAIWVTPMSPDSPATLARHQGRLPSTLDGLRVHKPTGGRKTRLGALADQAALKFRQRAKHVKDEPPLRVVSRASVRLRKPMPTSPVPRWFRSTASSSAPSFPHLDDRGGRQTQQRRRSTPQQIVRRQSNLAVTCLRGALTHPPRGCR
jgi:hypothetical protein